MDEVLLSRKTGNVHQENRRQHCSKWEVGTLSPFSHPCRQLYLCGVSGSSASGGWISQFKWMIYNFFIKEEQSKWKDENFLPTLHLWELLDFIVVRGIEMSDVGSGGTFDLEWNIIQLCMEYNNYIENNSVSWFIWKSRIYFCLPFNGMLWLPFSSNRVTEMVARLVSGVGR